MNAGVCTGTFRWAGLLCVPVGGGPVGVRLVGVDLHVDRTRRDGRRLHDRARRDGPRPSHLRGGRSSGARVAPLTIAVVARWAPVLLLFSGTRPGSLHPLMLACTLRLYLRPRSHGC